MQADPNDGIAGAYACVEVGASHFGVSGASPRPAADDRGQAFKVFGGYRLDAGLGIEVGDAVLGPFSEPVSPGSASTQQELRGRSLFVAATGQWSVGESFVLHGRLGLSSGRVSGTDQLPQADLRVGGRTSPLIGLGVEYRPRSNLALTLNHDDYGRLSTRVRASAPLLGLHFTL